LDNTNATKGCKNAVTILNDLEKNKNNNEKTQLCKTTPFDFIERYCSRLNYNKQMTKICQFIAMKIDKDGLIPENTPHSVAAGVIYFIADLCKLNITKQDVNRVSEISEVTINKCFKKLVTLKNSIVPPTILNKYE
jgi:transcription initiation factor TFIIIB Brf1 subunit/transcription initiation factor TFIIB